MSKLDHPRGHNQDSPPPDFYAPANAPTEPQEATADEGATQGANRPPQGDSEPQGEPVSPGLRALQRRNADRLGSLGRQGVHVPPLVILDVQVQALIQMLIDLELIEPETLIIKVEQLLSNVLDNVESNLTKAKLTQGISSNIKGGIKLK